MGTGGQELGEERVESGSPKDAGTGRNGESVCNFPMADHLIEV